MSEATDNVLNTADQALQMLVSTAASAQEFILAEVPEVIQQLLTWELFHNGGWALIWVCAALFCFRSHRKGLAIYRDPDDRRDEDNFTCGFPMVGGVFGVIAFGLVSISFIMTAVKILVAPKLYLLQYAASLLN
jgi:hypothetical protein